MLKLHFTMHFRSMVRKIHRKKEEKIAARTFFIFPERRFKNDFLFGSSCGSTLCKKGCTVFPVVICFFWGEEKSVSVPLVLRM